MKDNQNDQSNQNERLNAAAKIRAMALEEEQKGIYYEAGLHLEEALRIYREESGKDSLIVADLQMELARLRFARKQLDLAIDGYQEAIRVKEKADYSGFIECLRQIIAVYRSMGNDDLAEETYQRLIRACQKAYGETSLEAGEAFKGLAGLYHYTDRYDESTPLYLRALDIDQSILGPEHVRVADCTSMLAYLYERSEDRVDLAESYFRRTLAILEKEYGESSVRVGEANYRLAEFLYDHGHELEAELLYQSMVDLFLKILPNHSKWDWMLSSYIDYLKNLGRNETITSLFTRVIESYEQNGTPVYDWYRFVEDYIEFLEETGQLAEAKDWESRWNKYEIDRERNLAKIRQIEETKGKDHPDLPFYLYHYSAHVKTVQEREQLLRRALAINERALGPEDPETAESLGHLAYTLGLQKQYVEAEQLVKRALEILEKTLGKEGWQYGHNLELLADFYALQGNFEEGEALYRQSVAIAEESAGVESEKAAEALWRLAKFYVNTQHFEEAEASFIELLNRSDRIPDEEVSALEKSDYMENYMYLLEEMGRTEEADEMRQRVKTIWANQGEERDAL